MANEIIIRDCRQPSVIGEGRLTELLIRPSSDPDGKTAILSLSSGYEIYLGSRVLNEIIKQLTTEKLTK
jgi:hypothetical protein